MKYNIIGDIHGRTEWKNLVNLEDMNIFLGDYFDPYDNINFENLKNNFLNIIDFKIKYPNNVILLYGNHDYHYIVDDINEQYSRYDYTNAAQIKEIFNEFEDLFYGICYTFDQYVCTHAGISKEWYKLYFGKVDTDPKTIEKNINNLYKKHPYQFAFECNQHDQYEYYGDETSHSPIWIRPQSLVLSNIFQRTNIKQVVGHTQFKDIIEINGIIFTDCLGLKNACYTCEI